MNRQFRLASILRVRRIEEDQRSAAVVDSRRSSAAADQVVSRREQRIVERGVPSSGSGASFVNEMTALRVMAGQLQEDRRSAAEAHEALACDMEAWAAARARTRALERLEERHGKAVAAQELRIAQAEIDDIVAGRQVRAAAARYDS